MNLSEHIEIFIPVSEGLPENNGKYEALVSTNSNAFGGSFLTMLEFRNGKWIQKEGYCELNVLAWAPAG